MAKKIRIKADGDYLADVFARAARCDEFRHACDRLAEKYDALARRFNEVNSRPIPPTPPAPPQWVVNVNLKKEVAALEKENHELKAKVAQMAEAAMTPPPDHAYIDPTA